MFVVFPSEDYFQHEAEGELGLEDKAEKGKGDNDCKGVCYNLDSLVELCWRQILLSRILENIEGRFDAKL